jgi:hypothetical protein
VFFDLIETINCTFDQNGNMKRHEVTGEVVCNCRISGVPNIQLFLKFPKGFTDYYMHKCLLDNLEIFEKENILEFIAPNGKVPLFTYACESFVPKLPFLLNHSVKMIDKKHVRITIRLQHMLVNSTAYPMTNFHMKLPYNKEIMKFLTSSKREDKETHIKVNHDKGVIIWSVGQLGKDQMLSADLTFESRNEILELRELGKIIMSLKFDVMEYT